MIDVAAPRVAAGRRPVLIVEDDIAMAELERRALARAGYVPQIAPSVAAARTMLAGGGFVAILLDYSLPDGNAWDLVTQARDQRPHIPVIMVTAMGNESIAAEAVLRGVSEYIPKSEGFSELLGGAVDRAARLADADEEMRHNNSLFRMIANNAHDTIVLLDGGGTILFASAAAERMLGETPEALTGRDLAEFIHADDRAAWPGDGHAPPGRFPAQPFYRFRPREGHTVAFEPTFATIGEGPATRTLGVLRDVTERLRLEERVRHQQRLEAVGQLTGGLAHDFNNLLGVVIGNLDLLRDQPGISELVRELAQDALDAALRGVDLTHGLLAFARRQDLQPVRADLNQAIRSTARLLRRTLGEDITVKLRLADDVWPVSVDGSQLETALTNLATNARDAMPRGGRLLIETANVHLDADYAATQAEVSPGDYASIQVSDNGIGMPAAVLERIFEPFYTTKEPGQGTGLGLAMVFGFIKQSGGHIGVYSEVGHGTTVRLYLPRTSVAEPVSVTPSPLAQEGDGRTILVVEDNAKLRQLTARLLMAGGYRVLDTDDTQAALGIIDGAEVVDLLFTDVVMPGGVNGYDLARLAATRRPGLKILLTSGFPDLHTGGEATAPPHRLLHKPYRSEALLRTVREVLDT